MACPGAMRLNTSKIVVFLQNSILNTRFAVPGLGQGVMENKSGKPFNANTPILQHSITPSNWEALS
jgi:hypothetical protein